VTSPLIDTTQAVITARVQTRAEAVVEDCEWMARFGETLTGAAIRLGHSSRKTLDRTLWRAGRPDLIARLKANEADQLARLGVAERTRTRTA
jgi:hypothetical protein